MEWIWIVVTGLIVVGSLPLYAVLMQRRDRLQIKHWTDLTASKEPQPIRQIALEEGYSQ
jgi:hypothetical protein